jgi:hypothetical protein
MIALLIASVIAAASAANTPALVSAPNGVVGVQETVSISAPKSPGQVVSVTFSAAGATTQTGSVLTDGGGNATLPWTPSVPGTWTVTAAGATSSLAVGSVPTSTSLLAPNVVAANVATTYTATVTSLAGSIAPSGTVKLVDPTGATVATAKLAPGTTARSSSASLTWTPGYSTTALRAVFTPGTTAFGASSSATQSPVVGPDTTVVLQFPDTLYAGVPALLQGTTASGVAGGSLAFNQQISGCNFWIGGSHPTINSTASQLWAPTQSGYVTIGVQFATSDFTVNASASQPVLIQPAPKADSITLAANGGALPTTMNVGDTQTLAATATSTNPVTLSASGSCVIAGSTLRALAAGTCTVTAAAMGNGGSIAASTKSYATTVSAPPAPATKPAKKPAKR